MTTISNLTTASTTATSNLWMPVVDTTAGNPGHTYKMSVSQISTLAIGPQGISGYAGSRGYVGIGGYAGSIGRTGYTGSGDIGYSGSRGVIGSTGGAGYTGSRGAFDAIGFVGSVGPRGYQGSGGEGLIPGGATFQVLSKSSYSDYDVEWSDVTGLKSRVVSTATTAAITTGSTGNINITGFKAYSLMKVSTSDAAWVRLYTSDDARIADRLRTQGTRPTENSGMIAEVVTTGSSTQVITPAVFGFNDDTPPTTNIYAAVQNNSGSTTAISVSVTILQLES